VYCDLRHDGINMPRRNPGPEQAKACSRCLDCLYLLVPSPLRGGIGRGSTNRMYLDQNQRDFARYLRNLPTELDEDIWAVINEMKVPLRN
jgi:hypothetical protein